MWKLWLRHLSPHWSPGLRRFIWMFSLMYPFFQATPTSSICVPQTVHSVKRVHKWFQKSLTAQFWTLLARDLIISFHWFSNVCPHVSTSITQFPWLQFVLCVCNRPLRVSGGRGKWFTRRIPYGFSYTHSGIHYTLTFRNKRGAGAMVQWLGTLGSTRGPGLNSKHPHGSSYFFTW